MNIPGEKTAATRNSDTSPSLHQRDTEWEVERKALLEADLLATISHELRSPLTAINGYTTTLLIQENRITPEERREFLLIIKAASNRLEDLIAQMMEIAQLETGNVALHLSPVNLIHLFQETVVAVEESLAKRPAAQIEPLTTTPSTFTLLLDAAYNVSLTDGPVIQGDRRLLSKMLFHLLENARLHTPAGSRIEVAMRPAENTNRRILIDTRLPARQPALEISVHDCGSGIADEHLEHIFERFYRIETWLTREHSGLGLGLAICKEIVVLHQGTIWVESEIGQGSTFYVQLPVQGPA